MTREIRTVASIVLAMPAFVCLAAALWLRAKSDRMAASPEAEAIIDTGESLDGRYIPEPELLSPEGQAIRSKASRLTTIGLALIALALLNDVMI